MTTFIQTNAPLLFSSSWKSDDEEDDSSKYAGDDYDYVNLESKAKFDQDNEEVKRNLPQDMKNAFDVLVRQSESLPVLPVSDKVRLPSKLNCSLRNSLKMSPSTTNLEADRLHFGC